MANVLILEDNPEIASLYEQIFREHQTRVLGDVPDAISFLQEGQPDLVIMDFYLPSGSGVEVLNYMRSQSGLKDVPVLGVSVDDMLKEEAQQSGMNAFMTKPIDIRELIDTAQHLISTKPQAHTTPAPGPELRAALNDYAAAYQKIYGRKPQGTWNGTQVLINNQPCDERWLRSETRRLKSLSVGGDPRNYLLRLLDKVRRL
jgi:CheY-like chemotaxis protein